MDALRYVISRHFWLSSQVWFLFFCYSLKFLFFSLYRLAAAFPWFFFPVVEFYCNKETKIFIFWCI